MMTKGAGVLEAYELSEKMNAAQQRSYGDKFRGKYEKSDSKELEELADYINQLPLQTKQGVAV